MGQLYRIKVIHVSNKGRINIRVSFVTNNRFDYFVTSYARLVWIRYNGQIPEGYQIHHIDGNPSNDIIDNLMCVSSIRHQTIHNWV